MDSRYETRAQQYHTLLGLQQLWADLNANQARQPNSDDAHWTHAAIAAG
ncbi:unnamed protein product [Protopolystoma xenopodis]|uniref:Uncharacterized protein n=1 Tax=Protopolystoma xenopodis TaxID=117903 RepID=A0A448WPI7_9PLAT|nr:unnamed protein product [Protopolystoma xenopodis]